MMQRVKSITATFDDDTQMLWKFPESVSTTHDREEGEILYDSFAPPVQRITHRTVIEWAEWKEVSWL